MFGGATAGSEAHALRLSLVVIPAASCKVLPWLMNQTGPDEAAWGGTGSSTLRANSSRNALSPVKVVLTSMEGLTPPCSPNLASRVAKARRSTGSMAARC